MPTAIVTGATGILGREIVFELANAKETRWTIYALSRSKKESYPSNVKHTHIDLTGKAAEMVKELEGIHAEYLFFAAYLQKDTEQENWNVNGDMLEAFLQALDQTGAAKTLKRIILVTGAKQYGVHLGVPKNPMVESDPWLLNERYPPNFYYRQQDIVHDFCKSHPICSWVVTYPSVVIGFAKGSFMDLTTALALYAVVSKEMGKELIWPGCEAFYLLFDSLTSSKIHAQFCVWAALEPQAANQAFNIHNGDIESWQNLWPKVAEHFGMKVQPDQFLHAPSDGGVILPLLEEPPLFEFADILGLVGKTNQQSTVVERRIDLVKWSRRPEVKEAWAKVAEREGLQKDAFEQATWQFLNFIFGRNFSTVMSMSKARKMGWTGYADTWDTFVDVFEQLEAEKILPSRK